MAGIMNKLKDMWKPPEDEVEYEDNSYYDKHYNNINKKTQTRN